MHKLTRSSPLHTVRRRHKEDAIPNPLASSPASARKAIRRFNTELRDHPALAGNLAYQRSWYAMRRKGKWQFGPSKFIGYEALDAAAYLAQARDLDGRATEAHLAKWSDPVPEGSALYEELRAELFAMLGAHGKAPSTAMRLSVIDDAQAPPEDAASPLVELILQVAAGLPRRQRALLRARL
jgi:hypothetical protein